MTKIADKAMAADMSTPKSHGLLAALGYAALAALGIMALALQAYNPDGIPNSDDLLRMVQVRDLLAGQSWFDPVQYRLGLDGGTVMHWSRLVDGPMAVIYHLAEMFTGSRQTAELVLRLVWPTLMLFAAMCAIVVAALRTGKDNLLLPAVVIGAVALYSVSVFNFGTLDHHNLQIALVLWMVGLLLPGPRPVMAHGVAGVVAALMLGVGVEGLPYVALCGVWVALGYAFLDTPAKAARAFGLGLMITTMVIFAATIPWSRWGEASCDAFSRFHLALSFVGGAGLAATTVFASTGAIRLAGLAATAIIAGVTLIVAFPHCLADPLAGLDPLIRQFWLDGVVETRSAADLLASDPFTLVGTFGLMVCGLAVSAFGVVRTQRLFQKAALFLAIMLIAAIAITIWQQRAYTFGTAIAVFPMAAFVAWLRDRQEAEATTTRTLAMVGGWLVAINLTWWIAGTQLANAFAQGPTLGAQIASASAADYCYGADGYTALAAEPQSVVLGATDIGASVLHYTHHRAIAGPYHRNTAGIGLLIKTMLAKPDDAKRLIEDAGVTILADCVNSADAQDFRKAAPNGLQGALHDGAIPDWLTPVESTLGTPLVLYRVTPHSAWAIRN